MKNLCIISLILISHIGIIAAQEEIFECLDNPFFAFDNGTGRDQGVPLDQQAQMLLDAGYDGTGFTGTADIPAFLTELNARELTMFSTYVDSKVDMTQAIQDLSRSGAALWLFVRGYDNEDDAVQDIRRVADQAAEAGLDVVLYPHLGDNVATTRDALRFRELAERENVYVSFNLCHWLRQNEPHTYRDILQEAAPWLKLVSINGADSNGTNWNTLIQTLDEGTFEVYDLLKELKLLGFDGPVGLQAYNVPGDIATNLEKSMTAWQGFEARMRDEGCVDSIIAGCMDSSYNEYNPDAHVHDSSMCMTVGVGPAMPGPKGIAVNQTPILIIGPGPHSIQVLDLKGRVVFSTAGSGMKRYDLPNIKNAGLYIVRIKTNNVSRERILFYGF